MSAIELKPFYNEAQVAVAGGFILRLVVNFRTIDRLEGLLGTGLDEAIGKLAVSASMQGKFLWALTREHHNEELTLDQVAGIQFSDDGPAVMAALGDLVRRTFNLGGGPEEGEQSSRPPKRSNGTSHTSAKSGSRPGSIRKPSGMKRPARS